MSEPSDTNLDLDELSDAEEGVGLAVGLNEHFQPQKRS